MAKEKNLRKNCLLCGSRVKPRSLNLIVSCNPENFSGYGGKTQQQIDNEWEHYKDAVHSQDADKHYSGRDVIYGCTKCSFAIRENDIHRVK